MRSERATPLVSVALITRDEEASIEKCLLSVRELGDEVVIHDTGSTDRTVEIARALGAHVIEGEWRDDFAWARNVALDACRGEWVLSIDADEYLDNPSVTARRILSRLRTVPDSTNEVILRVLSVTGSRAAPVRPRTGFQVQRLFRRERMRWQGRIHELPRPIGDPGTNVVWDDVQIIHEGYLDEIWAARGKAERNLRIALLDDAVVDEAKHWFERARAFVLGGQTDEALHAYERAAATPTNDVGLRRSAVRLAAVLRLETGDVVGAAAALPELRALGTPKGIVDLLEARIALVQTDPHRALRLLTNLSGFSENFAVADECEVACLRAQALLMTGDNHAAVAEALRAIGERPDMHEAFLVLAHADHRGVPDIPKRLAMLVESGGLLPLVGVILAFGPEVTDRFCEALWYRFGPHSVLLAVASKLAVSDLGERAMTWRARSLDAGSAAANTPG